MSEEIWRRGATDLASAIAAGDVSSSEVVEAFLDRIEAVNPAVNAVTVVLADGQPHGVPFTAVQVIGSRFREDLSLEPAEAVEQRMGVITPIDPAG